MTTDAVPRCQYCGEPFHKGVCPRVKSIEYHDNGYTIKRVELHPLVQPCEHEWAPIDPAGNCSAYCTKCGEGFPSHLRLRP